MNPPTHTAEVRKNISPLSPHRRTGWEGNVGRVIAGLETGGSPSVRSELAISSLEQITGFFVNSRSAATIVFDSHRSLTSALLDRVIR